MKRDITDLQNAAKAHGGEILSTEYINIDTKYLWKCSEGHIWESVAYGVLHTNTWCPKCAGCKRTEIAEAQRLANNREGKCLSTTIENNREKLLWRCKNGHEWRADYHHISRGEWCPKCLGRHKTIDELKTAATNNGGELLSKEYKTVKYKYLWRCSKGHEWKTTAELVLNGCWCPRCAGHKEGSRTKKYTKEELEKIANEKGGKLLWQNKKSNKEKQLWECSCGHQWLSPPLYIVCGHWCPKCVGRLFLTLEEIKSIADSVAKERGGKVISEIVSTNTHAPILWQCKKGHTWYAALGNVNRHHTWCPHCVTFYQENRCREIIERLTGKLFPKNRKELGCRLELDGYCSDLKMAFEYNGEQHYQCIRRWKDTPETLEKRQKNDKKKADICAHKEIKLMIIPYTKRNNLEEFILVELERYNVPIFERIST